MSENLLGKKVHAKGKTGEIVRVYTVLGLKESERVNVWWDDGTVSVEMRLSDLQIVDWAGSLKAARRWYYLICSLFSAPLSAVPRWLPHGHTLAGLPNARSLPLGTFLEASPGGVCLCRCRS